MKCSQLNFIYILITEAVKNAQIDPKISRFQVLGIVGALQQKRTVCNFNFIIC